MHDYVYPSIFLAYLMFFLFVAGAIFFLIRSRKDGYWGSQSEDPKYQMLHDGLDELGDRDVKNSGGESQCQQ
ncbi:MAG: hypothetical protein LAP86_00405 [Acidobacteriia bacterium]|nr:hypothetical protein [Terriglobia bacterium]